MARRRPMRTPSNTRRGSHAMIEQLETRRLLYTTPAADGVFEFLDADNNVVRIVWENVTAEFIFYNPATGDIDDPVPAPQPGDEEVPDFGNDLFTVWVVQSDLTSYISMAVVEAPNEDGQPRPMQPFDGAPTASYLNRDTGEFEDIPAEGGAVWLGGRTPTDGDPGGVPVMRVLDFDGEGIIGPRSNGLTAGLIVEQDLGRFLVGGSISGEVTVVGSMELFYAGNVLTGMTEGFGAGQTNDAPLNPDNFTIGGDLRNLIVLNSIGTGTLDAGAGSTDPLYSTGFDMNIGGKLGQVWVGNSFFGSSRVANGDSDRIRGSQLEHELRTNPGTDRGEDTDFQNGFLGDSQITDVFNNDSFDDPQYLGVFDSRKFGDNTIYLHGTLSNTQQIGDVADYYAVPLLGNQTITVRLRQKDLPAGSAQTLRVGVFDPDGRLVATNYVNGSIGDTQQAGEPFQITTDRPGIYRIAVASHSATDFASAGENLGEFEYELQVLGVGELGYGALAAGVAISEMAANTFTNEFPQGLSAAQVDSGDIGAVFAGGSIASNLGGAVGNTVFAPNGSIRAVQSATIGVLNEETNTFGSGIGIDAGGNVGLISATGSGVLIFNDSARIPIGGNFEVIEAPLGILGAAVVANGSIGVVRVNSVAFDNYVSSFEINADRSTRTSDVLDLIDVLGDFGNGNVGGPPIINNGGNIRYLRAGGTIFRDAQFGDPDPEPTTFDPGERASFTDDSGVLVRLTPIPLERRIDFNTGSVILDDPGELTVTTYPIRTFGSGVAPGGGVVIMRVESTRGLLVEGGTRGNRGIAEVCSITVTGEGVEVIDDDATDPSSPLILDPDSENDLRVLVDGTGMVDVLNVEGGNFVEITNATGGEIVNVIADSIGTLAARTVGMAKRHTGAAVNPFSALAGDPGTDGDDNAEIRSIASVQAATTTGVFVDGDIIEIHAWQGVGNVGATRIQSIVANADGRFERGVHEGINGRILVDQVREVNIGEGLLPTGTGDVYYGAIHANEWVGRVINQGLGSDIMGDIIARAQNPVIVDDGDPDTVDVPLPAIREIRLTNGAIINADILVLAEFEQSRETFVDTRELPDFEGTLTAPAFELGEIRLDGVGGILGSSIAAADIDTVLINGGFGILNSSIGTTGGGTIDDVIADGYGIRFAGIGGGQVINNVVARGTGKTLVSTDYTPTVRWSESQRVNPYSGMRISALNDLHAILGTSAANPIRLDKKAINESGQLETVNFNVGREVNNITAHDIKATDIFAGNRVGVVTARNTVNDLFIVSGSLDRAKIGRDLDNSVWAISGRISTVEIGRNFTATSHIEAGGPDGTVGRIATGGMFNGTLVTQFDVGAISVGTSMEVLGVQYPEIFIGGNLGSLVVQGHIDSPTSIFVEDDIFQLIIGGDIKEGAVIEANDIRSQVIKGQVFGDVIIG